MQHSPFSSVSHQLLANGYSVLPLSPCEKKPLFSNWTRFSDQLPTEDNIDVWNNITDINVGVLLGGVSGIIALDFDYNVDGLHEKIEMMLPVSPVRKTGSKGYTAFYRSSGETTRKWGRNRQVVLEMLCHGRQTVLPPSIHPSGDVYQWITEATLLNTQADQLPYLSPEIIKKIDELFGIEEKGKHTLQLDDPEFDPADIPDALKYLDYDAYDTWVRIGMALKCSLQDDGYAYWDEWSKQSSKYSPWKTKQKWDSFNRTGVTINSVFYDAIREGYSPPYKPRNLKTVTVLAGGNLSGVKPSSVSAKTNSSSDSRRFPQHLLDAPGLAGRIAEWVTSTALYPQPVLALAAAIAATGVIYGHRIRSETNMRTNMMVIGIAPTGSGKDHARKCIISLFKAAGCSELLTGAPESGAGLLTGLKNAGGRCLSQIDELAYVLKSLKGKNAAAHKMSIPSNIMELYSSADTTFIGKELANRDGKIPRQDIEQPCLCIHGCTTPELFYETLTGSDISGGFLPRWLAFESFDYPLDESKAGDVNRPPQSLVDELRFWKDKKVGGLKGGNLSAPKISPETIIYTDEAREMINTYMRSMRVQMESDYGYSRDFKSRMAAHAIQLALVGHNGDCIDAEVMQWAIEVSEHCCKYFLMGIDKYSAANDYEGEVKKLVRILEDHGDWMNKTDLTAKTRFLKTGERNDILKTLDESDSIEIREVITEGSKKKTLEFRCK